MSRRNTKIVLLGAALSTMYFLLGRCVPVPEYGGEGQPCFTTKRNCQDGLECVGNVCAKTATGTDAGTPPDQGSSDSTGIPDTGSVPDAGDDAANDAGSDTGVDTGIPDTGLDAGEDVGETDAGGDVEKDSGQWIDGGDDGGDTDSGDKDACPVCDGNCPDSNMASIPAGSFWMGCDPSRDGGYCQESERDRYHMVTLSAYSIDENEVTVEAYTACVSAGVCSEPNEPNCQNQCNYGTDRADHPMNCVTWMQAVRFCAWVGKLLPTEAQWEKAARGTDGRQYPWGDSPRPDCDHAIIDNTMLDGGNDGGPQGPGCGDNLTRHVGSASKGKSLYGLFDMSGNVAEWVDGWLCEYGDGGLRTDPVCERPDAGPDASYSNICRGGSFTNGSDDLPLRVDYRLEIDEFEKGSCAIGFRCAKPTE
jgi:formylglycine-generating enzyme required for sulfatase activity